ncbi:MAG: hypothetical protein M9894_38785 [Planctomycetes bacterium]|nr:hypothetical protein [Planctomycetota bacterium]
MTRALLLALCVAALSAPARGDDDARGAAELLRHQLLGEPLRERQGRRAPRDAVAAAITAAAPTTLGAHQAGRVLPAYDALTPAERAAFDGLLRRFSDQPAVRDQLLKALAASSGLDDVTWLAGALDGRDAAWIAANTRLAPPGEAGPAVRQQFSDSCVPTTAQALRAEYDPVYALRTRLANPDVTGADDHDPMAMNPALAEEQRDVLLRYHGGPAPRASQDGWGIEVTRPLNDVAAFTGLTYRTHRGEPLEEALALIEAHLAQGRAVPLVVSRAFAPGEGGGGHAVMATAVRHDPAGAPSFLVFDPLAGQATWFSADELRRREMRFASFDRIAYVLTPG